jgi:hypothetical protein
LPQLAPSLQVGEQAGGWQTFAAQTPEPQSELAVQAVPSLQFGLQPPPDLHLLLLHWFEEQSALFPQAAPAPQFGAQDGVWQTPFVQTPEPQSEPAPQAVPSLQ